jgi:hypothetical protein
MSTTNQIIPSETWLPVPGYEGFYEVSDQGRVKSLDRYGRAFSDSTRIFKGKILKLKITKQGYLDIELRSRGTGKWFHVHQLVAMAFIGGKPEGMCVCHNNGIPSDNRPSNLRYDTPKSNIADMKIHGTVMNGGRNWASALTEQEVIEIFTCPHTKHYYQALSVQYGVSDVTIRNIWNGRTWSHLTGKVFNPRVIGKKSKKHQTTYRVTEDRDEFLVLSLD